MSGHVPAPDWVYDYGLLSNEILISCEPVQTPRQSARNRRHPQTLLGIASGASNVHIRKRHAPYPSRPKLFRLFPYPLLSGDVRILAWLLDIQLPYLWRPSSPANGIRCGSTLPSDLPGHIRTSSRFLTLLIRHIAIDQLSPVSI